MQHVHRETWLADLRDRYLKTYFLGQGYTIPANVRIGVGWPSRGGLGKKKRVIGQAWSNECSEDQTHEVIISLYLADPIKVVEVTIHELIHCTIGTEHGHRKPFSDACQKLGLVKPWTATSPSPELVALASTWIAALGPYPHAKLDGFQKKTEATRMLLMECVDCGLKIRTTQKWIDQHGIKWPCPCGGHLIHGDEDEEPISDGDE